MQHLVSPLRKSFYVNVKAIITHTKIAHLVSPLHHVYLCEGTVEAIITHTRIAHLVSPLRKSFYVNVKAIITHTKIAHLVSSLRKSFYVNVKAIITRDAKKMQIKV